MPIFSVVICILLMYIALCKETIINKFKYIIILDLFFEIVNIRGTFVSGVGNFFTDVTLLRIVVTFVGFYILLKKKTLIYKNELQWGFILIMCVLLGYFYEIISPYDGLIVPKDVYGIYVTGSSWDLYVRGFISQSYINLSSYTIVVNTIKVLWLVFLVLMLKNVFSLTEIKYVLYRLVYILKPYSIVIFIEFLIKNVFGIIGIWPDIQQLFCGKFGDLPFFGEDTLRGDFYALVGFSSEPSYVIICLFKILILIMIANKIAEINGENERANKTSKAYIGFIVLDMFLCGGASSIWYFIMLLILSVILSVDLYKKSIYYILSNVIYNMKYLVAIVVGVGGMFYIIQNSGMNYTDRIDAMISLITYVIIDGNIPYALLGNDTSTLARFTSIILTFLDFLNRPVFGLGVDVEFAHCFTITMLSSFGIVGTYSWWKLCMSNVNGGYDKPFAIIFFFVTGLFSGAAMIDSLLNINNYFFIEITSIYIVESQSRFLDNR